MEKNTCSRRRVLRNSALFGLPAAGVPVSAEKKGSADGEERTDFGELIKSIVAKHGSISVEKTWKTVDENTVAFTQRYVCEDGSTFLGKWVPHDLTDEHLETQGEMPRELEFTIYLSGEPVENASNLATTPQNTGTTTSTASVYTQTYDLKSIDGQGLSAPQSDNKLVGKGTSPGTAPSVQTQSTEAAIAPSSNFTFTSADDGDSSSGGLPSLGSSWHTYYLPENRSKAGVDAVHFGPQLTAESAVWIEYYLSSRNPNRTVDISIDGEYSYLYSALGAATSDIEIRIFIEHDEGLVDDRYLVNEGGQGVGYSTEDDTFDYTFNQTYLPYNGWYRIGIQVKTAASAGPYSVANADAYTDGRYAKFNSITIQ